MSRSFARVSLASLVTLASALTGADALAGCGGGRSSGRLSIAYHRNVPHMRSHAPRNNYHPPVHHQPVYQQPIYQQPVYQQPAVQPVVVQPRIVRQPAIQPQAPHQPVAPQPIAQQPIPQQPMQQPAVQQPAPQQPIAQQPATVSAEQSALDALAALGAPQAAASIPQFAPASQQQQAVHVGTWSATLPGDNRVQLVLNANGTFRWTANSKGKVSTFEGVFTVTDGRLTLVRSGDQQQLAGAWAAEGAGFRFQLGGDSGLLFVRG